MYQQIIKQDHNGIWSLELTLYGKQVYQATALTERGIRAKLIQWLYSTTNDSTEA